MLRTLFLIIPLLAILGLPVFALDIDDLRPEVRDLNVTARADLPGFRAELSSSFGIPLPRVDSLIATVGSPADAYFCLKIGRLSGKSLDVVTREFQQHGQHGWGVVARNLGIKPGSKGFHELKDTSKVKQKNKNKNSSKNKEKGNKKGK